MGKSFLSSGTDLSADKLTQSQLDKVNNKRRQQGITQLIKSQPGLLSCTLNETRALRMRSGSPKNLKLKYP